MSTRMGFRIQNEMLKDVLAICEDEGITRSDFITRALEREVSRCVINYMEEGISNSVVDACIRRRIKEDEKLTERLMSKTPVVTVHMPDGSKEVHELLPLKS